MEIIFRTRERERVRQELKREHLRPMISSSRARKSKLKISKALESESSNKMTNSLSVEWSADVRSNPETKV